MRTEQVLFAIIAVALVAIAGTGVAMMIKDSSPKENGTQQEMEDLAEKLNASPNMTVYVGAYTSYHTVDSKTTSLYQTNGSRLATIDGVIVHYLGPYADTWRTVTEKGTFSAYENGLIFIDEVTTEYTTEAPIPSGYPSDAVWLPPYKDTTTVTKKYIPYNEITKIVEEAYL